MIDERIPLIDIDQLHRLAALVSNNRAMMGSWLQNCEAEVIVSQLISGSSKNARRDRGPCSVRSDNVLVGRQRCGTDNAAAYKRLRVSNYFVEIKVKIKTATEVWLYPTQKLLDAVSRHFKEPVPGEEIPR